MIGSVLNIKQLEALVWVAELGSFRKAAHHLSTTQPNISTRIAGLERTLGVVLMLRDAGSISLTSKGQEILCAARKVLSEAEHIIDIAGRPDLVSDRLRLGVTELVACTWLHAYLRKIKAAFPALNVELTVDLSTNLDKAMMANQLDVAIQSAPFASPASGEVGLGAFTYIWVANAAIAAELEGPQSVADLLPHAVLTHARHTQAYGELTDLMKQRSLPSTRVVSSSSLASCVQMAADGMGVSLLPKALVDAAIADQTLFMVDVDWTASPLKFSARYAAETSANHVEVVANLAAEVVSEIFDG